MQRKVAKVSLLVVALMISITIPILVVTAKKEKLVLDPIIIDEFSILGPTWADLADKPWLKGSGTPEDPYMIKNVAINGEGSFYCIRILNSRAFFKIQDCSFSNAAIAGLILFNTQNGVIVKNRFLANGLGEGAGIGLMYSSYNRIQKNLCDENPVGIYLQYSNNNLITQNLCKGNIWVGIYIGDGSSYNRVTKNDCIENLEGILIFNDAINNEIERNDCSNNNGNGIYLSNNANHNLITRNDCYNNEGTGIVVETSNGNIITKNDCKENLAEGIALKNSNEHVITDNECSENEGIGIYLQSSNDNLIIQNLCNGNLRGIYIEEWSVDNEITKNDCSNNNKVGILLWYNANYNLITNNDCKENTVAGIVVGTSNGNIITDNHCSENGESGIAIVDWYGLNAIDNILCGNKIKNNLVGIYFSNVDKNDVFRNTIKANTNGIILDEYCEHNVIYHNNFIDNDVQARDEQIGSNFWYNRYMFEGNYWSDYTGTDSDSDSIGDTPWPEIGYDSYPFKEQDGWDSFTAEEEEIINAHFDPDSNRLKVSRPVHSDETCYISVGMKQLFSERIQRLFFPPYTVQIRFYGEEYSFLLLLQGSFWYYDEVAYDEPGYMQFFYIIIPPGGFLDLDLEPLGLKLELGEHNFQWIISFYDDGIYKNLVLDRTFELV